MFSAVAVFVAATVGVDEWTVIGVFPAAGALLDPPPQPATVLAMPASSAVAIFLVMRSPYVVVEPLLDVGLLGRLEVADPVPHLGQSLPVLWSEVKGSGRALVFNDHD